MIPSSTRALSLFVCGYLLLASQAFGNDSTAVLAAGGLRLEKSNDIAILSETLRVSPTKISVDYEMENLSNVAVDTQVAFPLPMLEAPTIVNTPIDTSRPDSENFIEFRTTVNGEPVNQQRQIRAFRIREDGAIAEDVTDVLTAAGILGSPLEPTFLDRVAALPPETLKRLEDRKLVDVFQGEKERNYTPLWAIELSFYWKQSFAPRKIVRIHHEYHPIVGRSLFGDFSLKDDFRPWCVDDSTMQAVRRLLERQPVKGQWTKILERKQIDYVLKTGSNWAGPIRSFDLILEKDRPEQIVSLCEKNITKVSATEFRIHKDDFSPTADLSVLFFDTLK